VGNSQPFAIGTNREAIVMPADGELLLNINDDRRTDNSGSFSVRLDPGCPLAWAGPAAREGWALCEPRGLPGSRHRPRSTRFSRGT